MSDAQQPKQPSHTSTASPESSELFEQYERACAEMQTAGRRLHRQMQEYQTVLDEVARLETADTPQAREKLQRLEALVQSEAFQRDEREIRRMTAALGHSVEQLRANVPQPLANAATPRPVTRAAGVRRSRA